MITSKLSQTTATPASFPCIKRAISRPELVVLFADHQVGTVVAVSNDEDEIYFVGDYSDNWDAAAFEIYTGTVSLSNDVNETVADKVSRDLLGALGALSGIPDAAPEQVVSELLSAMAGRHGQAPKVDAADLFSSAFADWASQGRAAQAADQASANDESTETSLDDQDEPAATHHVFVFNGGSGPDISDDEVKGLIQTLFAQGAFSGRPANDAQEAQRG